MDPKPEREHAGRDQRENQSEIPEDRPPAKGDNPLARINLGVLAPFEPGSIFKIVTLSAALETTDMTAESLVAHLRALLDALNVNSVGKWRAANSSTSIEICCEIGRQTCVTS